MGTKRRVVLILAVALAALGVYAWWIGAATVELLWMIGVGVGLATAYVIRGGTLPDIVYRSKLTRDDDPRNLPPRVYLPLLAAAVLIAALLFVLTVYR